MKTDKYQDKYDEIIRSMRDEKLDWTFEEFIKNASETPIITHKSHRKPIVWWASIAACAIILIGVGVLMRKQNAADKPQVLAKTEVVTYKDNAQPSNSRNVARTVSSNKEHTKTLADTKPVKQKSEQTRHETSPKENETAPKQTTTSDYQPSYVTINGQQITDEAEAIAATEQALNAFGSNMDMALTSMKEIEKFRIKI